MNINPERALVAAVLRMGIWDFVNKKRKMNKQEVLDYEDAKRWIYSESEAPYSFLWCCDVMEYNPEKIRLLIRTKPAVIRIDMKRSAA